jgi:4-amino-4-deoxy-L-arabinose transferase-like glycosyltransferase
MARQRIDEALKPTPEPMMKKAGKGHYLLIAIAASLLFIPFLGKVHLFDWDEINFAEAAREMVVTGNYSSVTINYQPFWEKPPLFMWMQAISMNLFGVNEFAARLPNAICGVVTLLVLFRIGRSIYDKRFGWVWVMCYTGAFLPHFYFKSGIIDPWFNLFIFLGIYFIILFSNNANAPPDNKRNRNLLILSAIFIGLGIMTKGPVALLVFGLTFAVYWLLKRRKPVITLKQVMIYIAAVASVGGLWFIIEAARGNFNVIIDFFVYQVRLLKTEDAGHGGPFFYHFAVLLIGCFPASVFTLRAFRKQATETEFQKHFKAWMLILLMVVLVLFSIVQTKIVHYSSLAYFPLTFIAAGGIYMIMNGEMQWKKWMTILILIIGVSLGTAIALMPLIEKYKWEIIRANVIADRMAIENLKASVHWSGWESLLGVFYVIGVLMSVWLIAKHRYTKGIVTLFIASMAMLNIALVAVVPKVEKYSQGTAIAFFERVREANGYVETLGYKSYAYLFYHRKKPDENRSPFFLEYMKLRNPDNKQTDPKEFKDIYTDWMLHGKLDRNAYFISRITEAENITGAYPQIKEFGRMNGFVFYIRKADQPR